MEFAMSSRLGSEMRKRQNVQDETEPSGVGAQSKVYSPKVTQHHRARQNHRRRVRLVRAHDILRDVSAPRLEERVLAPDVAAGDDTGATDERGADVRGDSAVQVGHDHHVELLGLGDELHRPVRVCA